MTPWEAYKKERGWENGGKTEPSDGAAPVAQSGKKMSPWEAYKQKRREQGLPEIPLITNATKIEPVAQRQAHRENVGLQRAVVENAPQVMKELQSEQNETAHAYQNASEQLRNMTAQLQDVIRQNL